MQTKFCPRCGEHRPVSEFYRNAARSDGVTGYCAKHQRESDVASRTSLRGRSKALAVLGAACPCGYTDIRALQIDHRNGGGATERRLIGASNALYRKVVADPSAYQLLCANCNLIKRLEEGEHVGARVYVRNPPTERRRAIGKGNAPAQRANLRWRDTATDEAKAERDRKAAASRTGSKLVAGEDGKRHFVHP